MGMRTHVPDEDFRPRYAITDVLPFNVMHRVHLDEEAATRAPSAPR